MVLQPSYSPHLLSSFVSVSTNCLLAFLKFQISLPKAEKEKHILFSSLNQDWIDYSLLYHISMEQAAVSSGKEWFIYLFYLIDFGKKTLNMWSQNIILNV